MTQAKPLIFKSVLGVYKLINMLYKKANNNNSRRASASRIVVALS
jgi:hypothetical protein